MKIPRLNYDPASALTFYEESLGALGALCERTWHDRLDIVAEGRAATLWNEDGALHAQELLFAPADATAAREAGREVFPGCPLTFRIAELLQPAPLACEKAVLREIAHTRIPDSHVLEKLWRTQYPTTGHWRITAEPKLAYHFSLVAIIRCEIQAIDQHWSLHRIAISLPGGEPDEHLARQIPLLEIDDSPTDIVTWPRVDPQHWWSLLSEALQLEIAPDIQIVRKRQEQYLDREIRRIDEYFAQYEKDLTKRVSRSSAARLKSGERLEAARLEHARRRGDQLARHEILVRPHLDALLLTAERAWQVPLDVTDQRTRRAAMPIFVPRSRRWFEPSSA
jgi:hypothetical protein